MTSFGCKEINLFGWYLHLRLQGQVCHHIGSLAPNGDQNAEFLQIYFIDEIDQIDSRMAITDYLRPRNSACFAATSACAQYFCKRVKIRI